MHNGLRGARDFVLDDAQERHDEDPARVDVGRDEREGVERAEQDAVSMCEVARGEHAEVLRGGVGVGAWIFDIPRVWF